MYQTHHVAYCTKVYNCVKKFETVTSFNTKTVNV